MDAMPFKLQLHFSLPCKQPHQDPKVSCWLRAHFEFPSLFLATRLPRSKQDIQLDKALSFWIREGARFLSVWIRSPHVAELSGQARWGEVPVPAIHGPSWGSLSPSPTELRWLQAILLSEGPFTIRPADLLLTLIQLVIQFWKFYFKAFISLPIFFFQSCSWECPILKFSRF